MFAELWSCFSARIDYLHMIDDVYCVLVAVMHYPPGIRPLIASIDKFISFDK